MNRTTECSFKRKYVYAMGEKYSKFRGKGLIAIDDEKIIVQGKRLYSPAILRGLIIVLLSAIPVMLFGIRLLLWPSLLISYYLLQYAILKSEEMSLRWEEIEKYEISPDEKTIAFSAMNMPAYSPVVMKLAEFEEIAATFREKIPARERTSRGLKGLEQRYADQAGIIERFFDKIF